MGRSVSYPSGAEVAFMHLDCDCTDGCGCWGDFIYDLKARAESLWPSLSIDDERWLGREDHALLGNRHAYFGVSEYCGLVAVWLVARDHDGIYSDDPPPAFSERWVSQAGDKLRTEFGQLRKLGTASNGESFFERINA